jgi:hypothetical protein
METTVCRKLRCRENILILADGLKIFPGTVTMGFKRSCSWASPNASAWTMIWCLPSTVVTPVDDRPNGATL